MIEYAAEIWGAIAIVAAVGLVRQIYRFMHFRRLVLDARRKKINGDVIYGGQVRIRSAAYLALVTAIILAVATARWVQAETLTMLTWPDIVAMVGFASLLAVLTAWSIHTAVAEQQQVGQ